MRFVETAAPTARTSVHRTASFLATLATLFAATLASHDVGAQPSRTLSSPTTAGST